MGYHIAAFLAIHEYLSLDENKQLPPFSFLVIDQPSQCISQAATVETTVLTRMSRSSRESVLQM